LKEAEDKLSKYDNFYLPRLRDTRKYQKELSDNIEQISQDAELLPSMFRAEAAFRIECRQEKDEAVKQMTVAMK